jgi:hypothetical protein
MTDNRWAVTVKRPIVSDVRYRPAERLSLPKLTKPERTLQSSRMTLKLSMLGVRRSRGTKSYGWPKRLAAVLVAVLLVR